MKFVIERRNASAYPRACVALSEGAAADSAFPALRQMIAGNLATLQLEVDLLSRAGGVKDAGSESS